jgi:zinc-binding alcohol dehydrogenase family protein
MKAIGLKQYLAINDPESLIDFDADMPQPSGHDLLVKVEAISVNPVDTKVRAPKEQTLDEMKILGWDACATVISVGPSVSLFTSGERIFYAGDISRQGCNSQFHLIDEHLCGHAPRSLDNADTAALPLTSLTAWEALFDRMKVSIDGANIHAKDRKTILIIGGAGGVGSIATQLANKLGELNVIATASREESSLWCKKMGASSVINHHTDIPAQLKELGVPQVDYILCCHNTDQHFDSMVEAIKPRGQICCIVDNTQPLAMNQLKAKSVTFSWEFMFTRAMFNMDDKIEQHHILSEVARLIDEGVLMGTRTKTLTPINAANLRKAHAEIEQGSMLGKLVLEAW